MNVSSIMFDDPPMSTGEGDVLLTALHLGQLLLCTLAVIVNMAVIGVVVGSSPLRRDAYHLLLANIWFANVVLGLTPITVIIGNVIQQQRGVVDSIVRSEMTGATINATASLATLIAILTTAIFATVQGEEGHQCHNRGRYKMGTASVIKVVSSIWTCVLILLATKTAILAAYHHFEGGACYECMLGFEVALLAIFVLLVATMLVIRACLVRSTANYDSVPQYEENLRQDGGNATMVVTIAGVLLCSFSFLALLLVASLLHQPLLTAVHVQLLLILYTMHAVVNPVIYVMRDSTAYNATCAIIGCKPSNQVNVQRTPNALLDAPPAYRTYDDLQGLPEDQGGGEERVVISHSLTINRSSILMV